MSTVTESLRARKAHAVSGERRVKMQPHPGQELFLKSPARYRVLICHRRWGKDWVCIRDLLAKAQHWSAEPRENLVPRVHIGVIYPTYELATEFWEALKAMVPAQDVKRKLESKPMVMEMAYGATIRVRSGDDPDKLVGAGYDLLIMGESARMREEAWHTVRPCLASPGRKGLAVFQTTPRGMDWNHRLYLRGQDAAFPDWESWNVPYYRSDMRTRHALANPYVDQARIQEDRVTYPDRWFRQEYMAEFLSGEGAVFRCVRKRIAPPPSPPQSPIVAGVDLAKHRDFTVCTAFDGQGRMLDIERMQQLPYQQQAERICGFLIRHRVSKVVVESNGPGDPVCEMLERDMHERRTGFSTACRLIPFLTTATSKRQMIDRLVVAFERAQISILNDPQLVNEFEAFSVAQTAAGHERFSAPEGGFDDCVMSCALAWTELGNRPILLSWPDPSDLDDLANDTWWEMD